MSYPPPLDWLLLLLGAGAFLTVYLPFSPMTIDLLNLRRETQLLLYRCRYGFWAAGSALFAILAGRLLFGGDGHGVVGAWLVGSVAILALLYWTGYVPFVMSPPAAAVHLTAYEACQRIAPDDIVLGLDVGGSSRAYLRDQIARPHYFRDSIDDKPLTVTYCILCNSAMAFDSVLDGRVLQLRCVTAFNNNIVFEDAASGNFIQQLDGAVIAGPDRGRQLPMLPLAMTTWREWVRLHPATTLFFAPSTALRDRMVDRMLAWMIPISRLATRTTPWHRVRGALDRRLPAMAFVLGVEVDGDCCAYPLAALGSAPVVNDVVGSQPVVVFFDAERELAQVFSRRVEGQVLTFHAVPGAPLARDATTGSSWSMAGRAVDGPSAGHRLTAIPHVNKLFWFSWAVFKPATRVWSATDERPPVPQIRLTTADTLSGE